MKERGRVQLQFGVIKRWHAIMTWHIAVHVSWSDGADKELLWHGGRGVENYLPDEILTYDCLLFVEQYNFMEGDAIYEQGTLAEH